MELIFNINLKRVLSMNLFRFYEISLDELYFWKNGVIFNHLGELNLRFNAMNRLREWGGFVLMV